MQTQPSLNQVIVRRIVTDVAVFVGKPAPDEVSHLRQTGFRYDRGQWSRSRNEAGVRPSAAVLEFE